jgi:hypothetical protein
MLIKATLIALISWQINAQESVAAATRQWGIRSGAFQLSIASDKDRYFVGEDVHVTSVLKNVSDGSVILARTQPVMFYDMDIRLPFPVWVDFKPRAALTTLGQRMKDHWDRSLHGGPLNPGKEVVDEFDLGKLYDMATPGDYHITFSCKLPPNSPGDPAIIVASNEIKVTIRPK